MKYLLCLLTIMLSLSNDLLAKDFLYFRNIKNCFLKSYSKGQFHPVQKNKFVNIPLDVKQFPENPKYVFFIYEGEKYVLSTNCLYLASEDNPEIKDLSSN